jgi:hypothetical protein
MYHDLRGGLGEDGETLVDASRVVEPQSSVQRIDLLNVDLFEVKLGVEQVLSCPSRVVTFKFHCQQRGMRGDGIRDSLLGITAIPR